VAAVAVAAALEEGGEVGAIGGARGMMDDEAVGPGVLSVVEAAGERPLLRETVSSRSMFSMLSRRASK